MNLLYRKREPDSISVRNEFSGIIQEKGEGMEGKVLCLGLIVGDFLVKPVERFPERGKLVLVERTELHLGGCAVNAGVVLKKLGIEVGIMGKVGNDNLGKFILHKLSEEGIDISSIKVDSSVSTSGTSVLIHKDGERSFLHSIGANSSISLKDIDIEYISKFSVLHIAGALLMPGFDGEPMANLAEEVKKKGVILTLDTAWDFYGRWFEVLNDVFPFVDYFLPSIEEARMITGEENPEDICRFLLKCGVKNVCLKMGEKGSFIMNEKEKYYFPPLKINVVDTTGAGDGYVAGFLAGFVRGYPFQKCGLIANLTGAKITTSMGATSGIKSWEDLIKFAEKHGYKI